MKVLNADELDEVRGDGSYENPYQVNLFFTDESGQFFTVNSHVPYVWPGPAIVKPTQDNTVLVGAANGTTAWQDSSLLLPSDYGMIE